MSRDRRGWFLGRLKERATQPQWRQNHLAEYTFEGRGCDTFDDQPDDDVGLVGIIAAGTRRTYWLPRDVSRSSPRRGIHRWTRTGHARSVGEQLTHRHVAPDPDRSKQ